MAKKQIEDTVNYITKDELKILARVSQDVFMFSNFCYVINPIKGKVPFKLYPYQQAVLYNFLKNRFNIILKFRQAGITELISMYCLWLTMYHENKKVNIISIKDTTAKKVLKKIKFMYKNLPPFMRTPIINGRSNEYGSCVTGDTRLITPDGSFEIKDICPSTRGSLYLDKPIKVLTHTGAFQRVIRGINKGILETWEVVDSKGKILKCTPKHKLLTIQGWKPVREIIENNLSIIQSDCSDYFPEEPPVALPPKEEIIKPTRYPGYYISNLGRIFTSKKKIGKGKGRAHISLDNPLKELTQNNKGNHSRIKLRLGNGDKLCTGVHRLVAEAFIGEIPEGYIVDHINCKPKDNYVTNLQIITPSENTKRAVKYSRLKVQARKNGLQDIQVIGAIKEKYQEYGDYYGVAKRIKKEVKPPFDHKRVSQICREIAYKHIYVSKLTLNRKFIAPIYDLEVEHDHSYITDTNYVNHNSSLIEFDNGSFIESIPTSPEAGRSEALTLLVIDEAAMVRWANEVFAASAPTLSCSVGSTPLFTKEYIKVKRGYTKSITKQVKLRNLCPKEKGILDISHLNLYTLTHTGQWKRILKSQNKGKLETWFVKDKLGKKGGFTPAHKLFTTRGWKTVAEIIENNLNVIQVDTKVNTLTKPPVTTPPTEEILKPLRELPGYSVSDNVAKPFKHNLSACLSGISYDKLPDLLKIGRVLEMAEQGYTHREISHEVYPESKRGHTFVKRILTERDSRVYISKLKVVKKTHRTIFDIEVEGDHSYISATNYVNHNTGGSAIINSTPRGIGGFYHSTWVDAISGHNGMNPIRLYWDMHPERDQSWYDTMSKMLGPKRTAQEIDGDFLSSGNTVFDLVDIKAIEDCLSDYPVIKTRFNGQYRQFLEPKEDESYYIGADVATGRSNDYSSFTLMNRFGEEYAIYKGRMAVDKYARFLGDTGELFNFAKIAPESNDVGLAVTSLLQTEGYPNLYFYQKLLRKKGKSKPETDLVPGWLTTNHNRPIIIEALEKDIREDNIIVKDPFFVQEAYTFIYDSLGRPVALNKHKSNSDSELEDEAYADDDIFGKAICNHIRKQKDNISTLPV